VECCSQIEIAEFAEIVRVQLKQISQDRLLLRRRGDNFHVCRSHLCMSSHNEQVGLSVTQEQSYEDEDPP
jgi:hypothetical protein